MILGQSYDMTYDNLTRSLNIFCKLPGKPLVYRALRWISLELQKKQTSKSELEEDAEQRPECNRLDIIRDYRADRRL